MSVSATTRERLTRLIDAMDRPLLGLAILTIALYLLDLHGLMGWGHTAYVAITFLIDLVFVFDLTIKLIALDGDYVQSPWFLIDFLSCLPVLDVIAASALRFRAIRIVRGIRILRILRGLRVLRALRSIPAFERFVKETTRSESAKRFHRTMNLGMIGLTIVILVTTVVLRKQMERRYIEKINTALRDASDVSYLRALGGSLEPPADDDNFVTRLAKVGNVERTVYFNLQPVDDRANQYEFFLILGMMFSMVMFMYIMAYHQLDVTQTQLRGLLNLALPQQVAEQFVVDPSAYTRKSTAPASIIFMDFVGFSRTCESLAHDPDLLSDHLERAMDRLVGELVKHDMIIDKFIGDSVMSFRGGPLVVGGIRDHAYRAVRASLDSIRALALLNDPYFNQVKIGGASADHCLIGAFGTSARLSYTILGEGVNLAARLEPACAQCGTQNLFDEATYQLCAQRHDILWRRWGRIRVEGRVVPVTVYEAFDPLTFGDAGFIATFHRALDAFEHSDFDRARDLFVLANNQRHGGDLPSQGYLLWCEQLLLGGPPVGWEPVFDTHK